LAEFYSPFPVDESNDIDHFRIESRRFLYSRKKERFISGINYIGTYERLRIFKGLFISSHNQWNNHIHGRNHNHDNHNYYSFNYTFCDEIKSNLLRTVCVAAEKRDRGICDLINDSETRDKCYYGVAVTGGDEEIIRYARCKH